MSLYVQYGSGPSSAPPRWRNFDNSPSLRIQRAPVVGRWLKRLTKVDFNERILFGDILGGLPDIERGSCDGIYCSHVLEHLPYDDCLLAIENTFRLLKVGGTFRCVVPDLEEAARSYVSRLEARDPHGSVEFMTTTLLGQQSRPRGVSGIIRSAFGNSDHRFMWDEFSLASALERAGFSTVRRCEFGDSPDEMFRLVEDKQRFESAVAFEAVK